MKKWCKKIGIEIFDKRPLIVSHIPVCLIFLLRVRQRVTGTLLKSGFLIDSFIITFIWNKQFGFITFNSMSVSVILCQIWELVMVSGFFYTVI